MKAHQYLPCHTNEPVINDVTDWRIHFVGLTITYLYVNFITYTIYVITKLLEMKCVIAQA